MNAQDQIFAWLRKLEAWKQELFRKTSAAPTLAEADVDEVVAMLLGEDDPPARPRAIAREDLPGAQRGDEPMAIQSLADLRNVNAIEDGEEISFEGGLNVVYGPNGAGKTGFSRILKHAGRTLRRETVLTNVTSAGSGKPSATVNVSIGGESQAVRLDLEVPAPAMLGRICIADADAGDRYLTDDTEVDYVPASLTSLSRLADGLKAVDERLKAMLADATPPGLDLRPYTEGTAVHRLLSDLEAATPDDLVAALAKLDEAEREQRQRLRRQRAAIEASEAPKLRAVAEREAGSAESLKQDLEAVADKLSASSLAAVSECRAALRELADAADLAAREFAEEPLDGIGSDPWRALWRAAKDYAAHVERSLPPDHDPASCPLCMQELGPDARQRLRRFDRFVRNDVNAKLAATEVELEKQLAALPKIEAEFATHREAIERLGTDEGQPGALIESWLADAARLVAALRAGEDAGSEPLGPPPSQIDGWIADRRGAVVEYRALEDAEDQKRVYRDLAELDDRQLLAERRQEVCDHLAALRRVEKLQAARKKLDKTAVSRKITALSRDLIEADIQDALNRQLDALAFRGLKVEAKSKSPGGTPKISLRFKTVDGVPLKAVLSQGEQRRLALAMFLAELEVISDPSPVVFDDPVSSIDQEGRRHIARTLLRLAAKRQVIVFTHELSFVYELTRLASSEQAAHVQHLRREKQTVGHVHPDLPWQGLSFKQRPATLYEELVVARKLYDERREAEYEEKAVTVSRQIREAFERAVEEGVLADVVTRRDDTIRLSKLARVAWSEEICELVDRGTDETSPWVHDRPRADGTSPPTPEELREGVETLEALLKAIKAHRRGESKGAGPRKPKLQTVKLPPSTDEKSPIRAVD